MAHNVGQFEPNSWIDYTTGITIKANRTNRISSAVRYAVMKDDCCLNKQGGWEVERSPSNRDDNYYDRCRWETLEDAIRACETCEST